MRVLDSLSAAERKTLYRVLAGLALAMIVLVAIAPRHKAGSNSFEQNYHLSFPDYEGNDVTLISFRLKPLIVFSWATWSPYSADEFAHLVSLKQRFGDKIRIVAINRGEPRVEAKSFTDKLGVADSMVLLLDPNDQYYKSIGGYAMPETMFISASGDERLHQRGPLDVPALEAGLQAAM